LKPTQNGHQPQRPYLTLVVSCTEWTHPLIALSEHLFSVEPVQSWAGWKARNRCDTLVLAAEPTFGIMRKKSEHPATVKRGNASALTMRGLDNREKRVLRILLGSQNGGLGVNQILELAGWSDQAHAVGAAMGLVEKGFANLTEVENVHVSLGTEGVHAAKDGLIEQRILLWLAKQDPSNRTIASISEEFGRSESGPGIGLLRGMGANIVNGNLELHDLDEAMKIAGERMDFIKEIEGLSVNSSGLDEKLLEHFSKRKGLIVSEKSIKRTWSASERALTLDLNEVIEIDQIGEVTPDLLQGESWKEREFKPFDIHAPAPIPLGGRPHPLQSLIDRIRAVFLEMGFSEIAGDFVQTAGWNMDALFIPQDHPARTMQDTFYLSSPESIKIDEERLMQWAGTHQDGRGTTSRGWGGVFDAKESERALLRTHTTVNTVKHIANNPAVPSRVFGVGRVFRQETIDRTHLPEFHQIEGIIHEEQASLPMLITTLRTFYSKMGYSDVRVRPAYFPYTEPSIEVEVLWKGAWLELGGAGIFRPEVTQPLGTEWPVCAWGMGLERLAMLILGLDDIRELYQPDLAILSKMPIL